MQELIQYFESLEARIAGYESRIAALEARVAQLEAQAKEKTALNEDVQQTLHEIKGIIDRQNVLLQTVSHSPESAEEQPTANNQEPIAEKQPVEEQPVEEQPIEEPVEIMESRDHEVTKEEPIAEEVPAAEEPAPQPTANSQQPITKEEPVSPNAALYGKAVDDIRQAISLGDRFLYQRELFAQNAELMQRTLTELNALGSFDEAIAYVNKHFQWDTESNTYQQFLVTLHRRFG